MYKTLRILVPVVHSALALIAFTVLKIGGTLNVGQDLVLTLNLPLAALWIVVFLPLRFLAPRLFEQPPPHSILVVLGMFLLLSVFVFWYLVVVEVELRRHGKSMLRPSGWPKQLAAALVILCCAGAAAYFAYTATEPYWKLNPYLEVIRGFFPAVWAVVLAGIGIHDLILALRAGFINRFGSKAGTLQP